ncbi:hypothetical protein [uncultured Campylobacter sp.]|uniref:hypothetical protein n=1 Tax=uncultured Campylobacter sp. TaxID=218934 RepID=UPI002602C916|nr:hypothetical protein [uncultured Campylobacter sp.]
MFKTIRLGMKIDKDIKRGIYYLMLLFLALIFYSFFVMIIYGDADYGVILGIAVIVVLGLPTFGIFWAIIRRAKNAIFRRFCEIATDENYKHLVDKIYALKREKREEERIDDYKYLTKEQFGPIVDFVYDNFLKSKEKALDLKNEINDYEITSSKHNPGLIADDPNYRPVGYDPVDGWEIWVGGEYGTIITLKTRITRKNRKELVCEINEELRKEIGYDPSLHEGANHIEFKNKNNNILYVIDWRFASNDKK